MKTKLALITALLSGGLQFTIAQNTSYYPDFQSIGGNWNTGLGPAALSNGALSGVLNTATGMNVLSANTSGEENSAFGANAMLNNTTGKLNVAVGAGALYYNSTNDFNVAVGSQALFNNVANENTAIGSHALWSNTGGSGNFSGGAFSLFNNVNGSSNVGIGYSALTQNIDGWNNVAVGANALRFNTTTGFISGAENVAIGASALYQNTTAQRGIAIGSYAMFSNQTGLDNTAVGYSALYNNLTGQSNCAFGNNSMVNTTSSNNTAMGYFALNANGTGYGNTTMGFYGMLNNTSGQLNTAIGMESLKVNTTGDANAVLGAAAMSSNDKGSLNSAVGFAVLATNVGNGVGTNGWYNSGLGAYADVSAANFNHATAIGANAIVNASNRVWIGSTTEHVWCQQAAWNTSDERFKSAIKEDDVKGLEFIKMLRPVVYNFDTKKLTEFLTKNMPDSIRKKHLDRDFSKTTNIRQSGFLAQEVEEAASKSGYNFSGVHAPEGEEDTYGLSYAQFVVPLVKAVQEQQAIIEKQNADHIAQMQDMQKQLEEQKQLISELKIASAKSLGINSPELIKGAFSMEQNEPNPFTFETKISYTISESSSIASLVIYDLTGKQILSFPLEEKGTGSIIINSNKLSAGIYIYTIIADGKLVDSKRMIVSEK